MRAIRGYSETARVLRVAHELGRSLSLELTTPVCMVGREADRIADGGKEVG